MRSEIIQSPALYLGKVEVREDEDSHGGRWLSGTRFKGWLYPAFRWGLEHLPLLFVRVPLRLVFAIARSVYWWQGNPLRQSCEYLCRITEASGYPHAPREVYLEYLSRLQATLENFCYLYRDGLDTVIDRVHVPAEDIERVNKLLEDHGGVVLAMPHNITSAFAGAQICRTFPTLGVVRNSSTIARTKVALSFYERMEVSILMVRAGNPFEFTRTMFAVLRAGKTVLATLDNVYNRSNSVSVSTFGQQVGFNPWAAKIAARLGVPIVPLYFRSSGRNVGVMVGESLITNDVGRAVQHYVNFFERNVLEDPASWAYLGDKHWRRVLREASHRVQNSDRSSSDPITP